MKKIIIFIILITGTVQLSEGQPRTFPNFPEETTPTTTDVLLIWDGAKNEKVKMSNIIVAGSVGIGAFDVTAAGDGLGLGLGNDLKVNTNTAYIVISSDDLDLLDHGIDSLKLGLTEVYLKHLAQEVIDSFGTLDLSGETNTGLLFNNSGVIDTDAGLTFAGGVTLSAPLVSLSIGLVSTGALQSDANIQAEDSIGVIDGGQFYGFCYDGTNGYMQFGSDTILYGSDLGSGTPGGVDLDMQYNNAGAFGGLTGFRKGYTSDTTLVLESVPSGDNGLFIFNNANGDGVEGYNTSGGIMFKFTNDAGAFGRGISGLVEGSSVGSYITVTGSGDAYTAELSGSSIAEGFKGTNNNSNASSATINITNNNAARGALFTEGNAASGNLIEISMDSTVATDAINITNEDRAVFSINDVGLVRTTNPKFYAAAADSSHTLDMTSNVFAHIDGNLMTEYRNRGAFVFQGDTVQIPVTGWYESKVSISFEGGVNDVYNAVHYVNNTQIDNRGHFKRKTSSADAGSAAMLLNYYFTAGDWVKLMVQNTANNNDATITNIDWKIEWDE